MGIHSFPKGHCALFTSIYIYTGISNLVYNYIPIRGVCVVCDYISRIRGVCVVCDYISRMLVVQGNLTICNTSQVK